MMEQTREQSNAEASPPALRLVWTSKTPAAPRQTGAAGLPILVGAGRMPGAAHEAGGLVPCGNWADWEQLLESQRG